MREAVAEGWGVRHRATQRAVVAAHPTTTTRRYGGKASLGADEGDEDSEVLRTSPLPTAGAYPRPPVSPLRLEGLGEAVGADVDEEEDHQARLLPVMGGAQAHDAGAVTPVVLHEERIPAVQEAQHARNCMCVACIEAELKSGFGEVQKAADGDKSVTRRRIRWTNV